MLIALHEYSPLSLIVAFAMCSVLLSFVERYFGDDFEKSMEVFACADEKVKLFKNQR